MHLPSLSTFVRRPLTRQTYEKEIFKVEPIVSAYSAQGTSVQQDLLVLSKVVRYEMNIPNVNLVN